MRQRTGAPTPRLVFACRPDNDLFVVACRTVRPRPVQFDTPAAAISAAPDGAGILILADGYPERTSPVDAALYEEAARRRLRLYVEYPSSLPGLEVGAPRGTVWERAVVASDAFGPSLPQPSILGVHDCRFLPVKAGHGDIVEARVAGFDTAVYGLPPATWPLLFEARPGLLVATTRLSGFVTGRFAPAAAWTAVWRSILDRIDPGGSGHDLKWTPIVRPAYGRDAPLPRDVEAKALRRAVDWYFRARMLIHPSWAKVYDDEAKAWPDRIGPMPHLDWPVGDGSLGVLEGFNAAIRHDGSQQARWWRRNDCNGEVAGTLALAALALKDAGWRRASGNIGDWLYFRSILSLGRRADPTDPAYGLIGWNDVTRYWGDLDGYGVYYGDDNARSMLGMIAAAAGLKTDRWDERLAKCLLANLRLAGRKGFQPDRIDEGPLERNGWRAYHDSADEVYSPHYQAYMWACYLWAYRQTGYRPFLERARTAVGLTMAAYPRDWRGPVGMQLARARMLLPLAWLVRVDDTPEHRAWLRRMAEETLARQDASGAVREQVGRPGTGEAPAPASNEAYGTGEAPIAQTNDDPASDILYTTNFVFLGLHEAAAATGDPWYRDAEDRVARFLCRIQVRSGSHPELDGAWFRAFDFGRWDYWASNADVGWGAWCIESGWSQSWIASVFALRRLHTSLWDFTSGSRIGQRFGAVREEMLPDER